jgi:hypothetical protein
MLAVRVDGEENLCPALSGLLKTIVYGRIVTKIGLMTYNDRASRARLIGSRIRRMVVNDDHSRNVSKNRSNDRLHRPRLIVSWYHSDDGQIR